MVRCTGALLTGLLILACPVAAQPDVSSVGREAKVTVNGISVAYRIYGRREGRPLLLIAGTGMQMIEWPRALIDGLDRHGFRVIVFDNRDAGRSTHFTAAGAPDWQAIFTAMANGTTPGLPYRASDMAGDAVALLDRLGVVTADVVGVSGGATVAELMAIAKPARVRSLTLLMANAGDPTIPLPADPARAAAIPPPPIGETPAQQIERRISTYRALAGCGFPEDETRYTQLAVAATARDPDPQGVARQGAALITLGDLRVRLGAIKAPTMVIHGGDDPLISPRAGRQVADAIPSARFLQINGMGHDLPTAAIDRVLEAIDSVARPRP